VNERQTNKVLMSLVSITTSANTSRHHKESTPSM